MSTNLFWEPVKPPRGKSLGKGIKWALEREYGVEATLTDADIPFLKGVRASQFKPDDETAQDADTLIEAIEKHGTIRIWISG